MVGKRYVQHISGQGEKWELQTQYTGESDYWTVYNRTSNYRSALQLPKSEYHLCDPPERWVDVTKDCYLNVKGTTVMISGGEIVGLYHDDIFRFMLKDGTLRIERKETA